MALTPEQKRQLRAKRKHERAAADELRGVKRQPRGGVPLHHRWDERAGAWVLDVAGEALERRQLELPPLASRPEYPNVLVTTNPPPSRHDFATQELYDEARERWYEMLMGKRLPPYSQSKARASAWGNATRRYVYHKYEHESMAEELAAAREDFPCARECRCSLRWPLGTRLVIKGVEKELRKDNYGVFGWWTVRHQC